MLQALLVLLLALGAASKVDKPNIVFFLTDDQDTLLGGYTPMKKATALLNDKGATATNFYIHTPICCPSRGELLTGRYLHNIRTADGMSGCQRHLDLNKVNNFTFAKALADNGYTVGMFGKYLNTCPESPPPGFDAWFANGGGSYLAPTFFTNNGTWHGSATDYTTSVVGNKSIEWIRSVAHRPFFAYIAPKAPHGPAEPAPWYKDAFPGERAPRMPSWNYHGADHHYTVAKQPDLEHTPHGNITDRIDDVFVRRWRCLLSVDDLIEGVVQAVDDLGLTNRTYFLYTSDHGYQLGELRLPCDKRNVYEMDVRIHMTVRGPGIAAGSTFDTLASNVDIAPTLLDMAGIASPPEMDGRSFLPFITGREVAEWRDMHFIEYYHVADQAGCGMIDGWSIDDVTNNYIAVRVQNKEFGNILYAEFQSGEGHVVFDSPDFYEMYDMDSDPWQMHNIYNKTDKAVTQKLHAILHSIYACKGSSCP